VLQGPELRPPTIPYIYQTPKGLDIDLRLFNKGEVKLCVSISYLLCFLYPFDEFSPTMILPTRPIQSDTYS